MIDWAEAFGGVGSVKLIIRAKIFVGIKGKRIIVRYNQERTVILIKEG